MKAPEPVSTTSGLRETMSLPRQGRLATWAVRLRVPLLFLSQGLLLAAALVVAFFLRFDPSRSGRLSGEILAILPVYVGVHLGMLYLLGAFHGLWRYVTMWDAVRIIQAVTLGSVALATMDFLLGPPQWLPRSVYFMSWALSIGFLGGLRFSVRLFRETYRYRSIHPFSRAETGDLRVVIVGAGDAGYQLARELIEKHGRTYELVGFLDDDPLKSGQKMLDLPILGRVQDLAEVRREHGIDEAVIAMPSASGKVIRGIMRICADVGVTARVLPGLSALIDGKAHVTQLRPISVVDLLRRAPVHLDQAGIDTRNLFLSMPTQCKGFSYLGHTLGDFLI